MTEDELDTELLALRLQTLENRVADLERSSRSAAPSGHDNATPDPSGALPPDAPGNAGRDTSSDAPDVLPPAFWALNRIREDHPDGAVLFTGQMPTPAGPVAWQFTRTADELQSVDWAERAPVLDALGHPIRLMLLQLISSGVDSTAELAQQDSLGSTGQIHHHLRILLNAGWLTHTGRGRYAVPSTRTIPLFAILTAAERT